MDSTRFCQIGFAIIATYAMHSTLLLAAAWLLDRSRTWSSPSIREQLWKWATIAPFLTTAIQCSWTNTAPLWELRLGEVSVRSETPTAEDAPESALRAFKALTVEPIEAIDTANSVTSVGMGANEETENAPSEMEILPATSGNRNSTAAMRHVDTVRSKDDATDSLVEVQTQSHQPQGENIESEPALQATDAVAPATLSDSQSAVFPWQLPGLMTFVACCMMLGQLRLWICIVCVAFHLRRCVQLREGRAGSALQELCRDRKIRKPVRLLISDHVSEPSACGIFRWVIVLPSDLETNLNHAELTALLSHELGHLVRRDTVWLWIGRAFTFCLPWQPLHFLAVKRWQQAAEFQCDEWALAGNVEGITLARVLTNVAEWKKHGALTPGLPASAPPLILRVERLLASDHRNDRWSTGWRRRALLLSLLAVPLGVTAFGPRLSWAAVPDAPQRLIASVTTGQADVATEAPRINVSSDALRRELLELTADLELALSLLASQEQDPAVRQKTKVILERLQYIQQSVTNLDQ